jgi:CRISPR-associated protein Csd1
MILQRLAEQYDRIAGSNKDDTQLARPGFSRQKISFCVVLNPDGSLNSFQSLQEKIGSKLVALEKIVPGQTKSSGSGLNPCFLWDTSAYMLGYKINDLKPSRTDKEFQSFRDYHLLLQTQIAHPAFDTVCAFLRTWTPSEALKHESSLAKMATNRGVFKIAATMGYVHELVAAPKRIAKIKQGDKNRGTTGLCLVTGEEEKIAVLHKPEIKGVRGTRAGGVPLVSMNLPSVCSYGKEQGLNAPVSAGVAFRYANALNWLLKKENRRVVFLGDSTVVFWADHVNVLENCLSEMFGDLPDEGPIIQEDEERLREAALLLKQLRDGTGATEISPDGVETKFYLLGLSPNAEKDASRISVRLWVEADATELQRRLGQHLRDVELLDPREERLLTLRRIAYETGRAYRENGKLKFDPKSTSPQLAGDLARSVLTGAAYPQSLLATMIRRIHSDGEVAYARVAAIKACLNRNSRLHENPLEVSRMLDKNNDDAAYCCGRAFALLEMVQRNSRKKWKDSAEEQEDQKNRADNSREDDGPTIKDHYFSSASTTPSIVFPRLFRLYQHHLAKLKQLNVGLSIRREQALGEIMNKITVFPRLLSLEDQGKFVLGYFHQRQDLYTSKKIKEEGANA